MEVARGTPPRFGNPAPSLTKGGRRSLPPGQHLTAANAPAARRWSLSAGHHFSAPAHPSGRPQQQQAVFRATDYPAGAPCEPILRALPEGPAASAGQRQGDQRACRSASDCCAGIVNEGKCAVPVTRIGRPLPRYNKPSNERLDLCCRVSIC